MKNTTVKSLILVVALLLCVTLVFAACNTANFQPLTDKPQGQTPEGNGGVAVKYGDWLYFVNGYNSDTTADNGYTNDVKDAPRVGSVARIKLADLKGLFDIQDESNKTSTEKSDESEEYVRTHAQTVVPKIYYNGNTDSATLELNGLYIFNDRIYVTTPNDALTAGGDTLTDQLVLTSFDLGGGDMKTHFTFTSNNVQIAYKTNNDNKLCATYVMDSKVYYLDVDAGTSKEVVIEGTDEAADVDNTYGSITWDLSSGQCLFFIDKMYNICKLGFGEQNYKVIVANGTAEYHKAEKEGETSHVEAPDTSTDKGYTFTINSVNCGQVYYTKTTYSTDHKIYWAASADDKDKVALDTNSSSVTMKAWKDGKMVYSKAVKDSSFYGVYVNVSRDGSNPQTILLPSVNKSSITIDRIVGDTLYYTANSIKYTLDLNTTDQEKGTPYAKNLGSAAGWAQPDFFAYDNVAYVLTPTGGGLTIAQFDASDPDKSQTSVSLLLKAKAED